MKILYCNKYNFPFSGTEVYLFDAMRLLRAQGHEAALFSMADSRGEPTPYDRHFVPHLEFNRTASPLVNLKQAAHAIYSPVARKCLRAMIEEFQPDVAHVRNIYHHFSPSILWELKRQGIPVIYHLNDLKLLCPSYNMVSRGEACELCAHGSAWHVVSRNCYRGGRAAAIVLAVEADFHRWMRTYQRCVDLFLAPSNFVKEVMVRAGWNPSKIEVLPHFQKLSDRPPPPPPPGAPILYFGRLSKEKGIPDLLRAMSRLPHIHLEIAGSGPQREELESLQHALRLRNVQFLGHVPAEALESLIASSAFTVFPSHAYETFGKAIVESYAQGRAVVASDLGSRRELLISGETGLLYPPGNVEELARTLDFLYNRPALARQMGLAGRELTRLKCDPGTHIRALVGLYASLAKPIPSSNIRPWPRPQPRTVRVAFLGGRGVGSPYSGIEAAWEQTGERLARRGHQVTVYCRNNFTPTLPTYKGMRIVRLPTIYSKHLETFLHTLLSTIHACCCDCDIVHYQALGPALFSFLPRLFGKRSVVTVQGLDWQRRKWGLLASSVLRMGEWASARFPNVTVVVSRELQQRYRERHHVECHFIPNGTHLREAMPVRHLPAWGLTRQEYVLYLGRFSPEKNCDLLIRAFERLGGGMKLVLAGGSSHSQAYAQALKSHESPRIRLLDWIAGDQLDELLTNAALFVLPSDLEGLSLALLDAMGAGICVLTSDIPENRELIQGVGFTFRRGEVNDLERMLRLLIADPGLRTRAGQAGRRRVAEQYLWPEITQKLEHLYLELAGLAHGKISAEGEDTRPVKTAANAS